MPNIGIYYTELRKKLHISDSKKCVPFYRTLLQIISEGVIIFGEGYIDEVASKIDKSNYCLC